MDANGPEAVWESLPKALKALSWLDAVGTPGSQACALRTERDRPPKPTGCRIRIEEYLDVVVSNVTLVFALRAQSSDDRMWAMASQLGRHAAERSVGSDQEPSANLGWYPFSSDIELYAAIHEAIPSTSEDHESLESRQRQQPDTSLHRLADDTAIEFASIDHVCMDAIAADRGRRATGHVYDGASDRVEDHVFADIGQRQCPRRHKTRAMAGRADGRVFLEQGHVEAKQREVSGNPGTCGARANDDGVIDPFGQ
jgi:hypothetical protein